MASNSKQQKLTSFFAQNKNKNAVSGQNEKVKLSKNQRLRRYEQTRYIHRQSRGVIELYIFHSYTKSIYNIFI